MSDHIPAFPQERESEEIAGDVERHFGLSMRDYFAARAMEGHIGELSGIEGEEHAVVIARLSYMYADAMIRERVRKSEPETWRHTCRDVKGSTAIDEIPVGGLCMICGANQGTDRIRQRVEERERAQGSVNHD
jgi:hypothetical protein